jgi:hypothetical protein
MNQDKASDTLAELLKASITVNVYDYADLHSPILSTWALDDSFHISTKPSNSQSPKPELRYGDNTLWLLIPPDFRVLDVIANMEKGTVDVVVQSIPAFRKGDDTL